ncbi:MAG TPA: O-antigen ligase family protein [Opitutaceae bacterium]|nr:O-antigen ligase family protein [Opitutaceae bacterium]
MSSRTFAFSAVPEAEAPEAEARPALLFQPSAWATFAAGVLTPFTLNFVGEMPVGELVLCAVTVWIAICWLVGRSWPSPLLADGLTRGFLLAQFVAFCAYVVADLYWHSSLHDIERGWSRMAFLAIDFVAVAHLFGRDRRNFPVLLAGLCLGDVASAYLNGPMFGDYWKFGYGITLSYLGVLLGSCLGGWGAVLAAVGMGLANFAMDFRSFGGLCLALATLTFLQMLPRKLRLWTAPLALAAATVGVVVVAQPEQAGQRATRSDVERQAMITAAAEAFHDSPFIGHGSWFSNSHVYENFLYIRHSLAAAAHVGGFADANEDRGDMAIHSQILVALAEGGIFGGTFFLLLGGALLWALGDAVFATPWTRLAPIRLLVLLAAVWNLLFSPFSGAHRVYIALACGLILLQREERRRRLREEEGG